MAPTVDNLKEHVINTFPKWAADYRRVPLEMNRQDLKDWLDGDDSIRLSVADLLGQFALYELKTFVLESITNSVDMKRLALAARLFFPSLPYAIAVQSLNTNSAVSFPEFTNGLAVIATVGWRDETELLARLALQELAKSEIRRGKFHGGGLGQGVTSFGFPYAFFDIMQDWLKADHVSTDTLWRKKTYEDYTGGYGGWAELVEGWREPNPIAFSCILQRAADYHVAQSREMETRGYKNDSEFQEIHYEIEMDAYWLLPVLLFLVLRLREWEGLQNPGFIDHELFQKGIFQQLPKSMPWPADSFYDELDVRFRAAFPKTPSTADLLHLRDVQS